MDIDNIEDLAKELKDEKNKNVYTLFYEYAEKNNIDSEELEEILAKNHDCYRCDSCERFYTYEEYSFFDEECTYCFDDEGDDENDDEEDYEYSEEGEEEF